MKARFLMPLVIFLGLAALLGVGLTLNPRDVPSVLINVWGTWCPECWKEHAFLNRLSKEEGVTLVGIDWRDEREEAKAFLAKKGNPFVAVGFDPESEAIMDWGVYGAPETFVIDKQGMIRKKHTGPLYPQIWESEFKPLLKQLEAES
jgi:cytochrome c biogenesis protein CcmG/thiol:disulfide interchange protein DsbE